VLDFAGGGRPCWGTVTAGCTNGGGGERDDAAVDSDPAAALAAWERQRE
jgi:hypothetical protein